MSTIAPLRTWRSTLARLAALLAVCAPLASPAAEATDALTLPEAVALAVGRSGQLAALQAQQSAAREMAVAAGRRPDPVLKLGVSNLPVDGDNAWSLTRDFMTMRNIGLMQEFPRADKRAAMSARALAEGEVFAAARQLRAAELQRDTALAWLDASMQASLRGLLQAQRAEAELQVQATEAVVRGGRGAPADLFSARGEVALLDDRLDQVQREVDLAATRLARWIGDAARRPPAPRPEFALPAWAASSDDAHVLDPHLAAHPTLQLADRQQALAAAGVTLARTRRETDWSVELMFSQRGQAFSNMVSLNFALPLPWDRANKQDRELAAAQAQADAATAEREDQQRAHLGEVRAMLVEWRSHRARLVRFDRTLLPLAQQREQAALGAYRGGGGTLAEVLAARRAALALQVDRLEIEIALARRWAQLSTVAGSADLPTITTAPRSPR